ncbi:predicted protein [Plenodomus lingam JN3]|uniref:Predicted protein n=1 Tax=Leptosphaeria maculans (strain JN3 / isolate v23.1.3 / race Av1-4-5-6-7-8) TaxID=985895 RepID=E5A3C3_LEPMJ|nr:predicted protein [Plenodomus lingam JN3]CBX98136.1 predicted protein [Plenodomus lingam JN3]
MAKLDSELGPGSLDSVGIHQSKNQWPFAIREFHLWETRIVGKHPARPNIVKPNKVPYPTMAYLY